MKVSQESWKLMKDKLLFCFIDILILVFDMFLLIKIQLTLSLFCPLLSQQESEFQAKFIFIHFRDFLAEQFEAFI